MDAASSLATSPFDVDVDATRDAASTDETWLTQRAARRTRRARRAQAKDVGRRGARRVIGAGHAMGTSCRVGDTTGPVLPASRADPSHGDVSAADAASRRCSGGNVAR